MGAREVGDVGDGKRNREGVIFGDEIHRRLEDGAAIIDGDQVIHFRHGNSYKSQRGGVSWERPARQLFGRSVDILRWSDAP